MLCSLVVSPICGTTSYFALSDQHLVLFPSNFEALGKR